MSRRRRWPEPGKERPHRRLVVSRQMQPTLAGERIRFQGAGQFSRTLNRRAELVLADPAMMRRAYQRLWGKTALVLAWTAASYLFLLLVAASPIAVVAGSVSLGLATAAIGFCIMHDANHRGYSRNLTVNRIAAHSLDLIGGSSYVWAAKHLAHHAYTNVADHDPDIDALPFARFEPTQKRHPVHRYQHIYMWLLYAFVTMRWQFATDFTFIARGAAGRSTFKRPRGWNLLALVVGKVFFVGWAIAIPLALHSTLVVVIVFTFVSAVASLALTITFQLSHCLEETITLAPGDQLAASSPRPEWHIHQIEATANFAQTNPVIVWYTGGLNHQIEHHLFPRVPHTLYPQLAVIVRQAALEHGIAYHSHPTIRSAVRSHSRWLKQMGTATTLAISS
jgi:linoleoyl-CoA desaturase